MSCGVGHRRNSDLVLLWLWRRLAAIALIRPLAWEPPYAVGVDLEKTKKTKKKKKRERERAFQAAWPPYQDPRVFPSRSFAIALALSLAEARLRVLCAPVCGTWKENVEEAQFAYDTGLDMANTTATTPLNFSSLVTWLCTLAGMLGSSVKPCWAVTPTYSFLMIFIFSHYS